MNFCCVLVRIIFCLLNRCECTGGIQKHGTILIQAKNHTTKSVGNSYIFSRHTTKFVGSFCKQHRQNIISNIGVKHFVAKIVNITSNLVVRVDHHQFLCQITPRHSITVRLIRIFQRCSEIHNHLWLTFSS